MQKDRRYPWYIIELVGFLFLNFIAFWLLQDHIDFDSFMSPWRFLLVGLSVYRISTIISDETITKPFRAPFVKEEKKGNIKVEEPRKSGLRGSLGSLLYCPSCVGVWIASFLLYSFALWPQLTWVFVIILALSAVERVVTGFTEFLQQHS